MTVRKNEAEFKVGEPMDLDSVKPESHETTPPPRFTEPQLVAKLEDLGIGRPSTYAQIVTVNQTRGYVQKKGKALVPTWRGMQVARILGAKTPSFVDYGYTARMEDQLDEISQGKVTKTDFLKRAWDGKDGVDTKVNGLRKNVDWSEINGLSTIRLPSGYQVRVSRNGAWLEDPNGERTPEGWLRGVKLDDDVLVGDDPLNAEQCKELLQHANGPKELGTLEEGPYKEWRVTIRDGRYGPYAQAVRIGRNGKPSRKDKPVNQSLPSGLDPEKATMDDVKPLFADIKLPRQLGEGYFTGIGKRGPWIGFKRTPRGRARFVGLDDNENPRTITLEKAKEIWSAKADSKTTSKRGNNGRTSHSRSKSKH